jgi:hypothetical protein
LDFLTLEDRTDTLTRNVGKQLPHDVILEDETCTFSRNVGKNLPRDIPEERTSHQHRGGSLKPRFVDVIRKIAKNDY